MRKLAVLGAAAAALVTVAIAAPASAITRGGVEDGDDHPFVGLMIAEQEVYADGPDGPVLVGYEPLWRCSGALVSPTLYVTAGHCTFGADRVELWFTDDLEPNPALHGYLDYDQVAPYDFDLDGDGETDDFDLDGDGVQDLDLSDLFIGEVSGTATAHDGYVDAAFWAYDLGVVELDAPVILDDGYATLAPLGYVDTMTKGRNKDSSKVTAVGYGLQEIVEGPTKFDFDPKLRADKTRYQADLMIVNTKGVAGLGPINPNQSFTMSGDAKHGGTCFGDSGGPILAYDTNMIVGVNSFGLNANCAGVGGAYRVDQQDDIDFLAPFLTAHPVP